jgi:hypothetical protein
MFRQLSRKTAKLSYFLASMTALSNHLDRMFVWLRDIGLQPPSENVRFVEIKQSEYDAEDKTLHIRADQLCTSSEFESRFDELLRMGYFWINFSCYGVHDGLLVVGIEQPSFDKEKPEPLRPGCNTSVNLSGPRYDVLADEWRVDQVLTIS